MGSPPPLLKAPRLFYTGVLVLSLAVGLDACAASTGDTGRSAMANEEPIALLASQDVGFGATGRFEVGHDGAATYTIPLLVPAGRRGMQPTLQLTYSSNRGDSGVGVGWTVTGASSVARCRRSAALDGAPDRVEFDDEDALCLDGRRLVLVDGAAAQDGARYRPQRNGHELLILRGDLSDAASWFEVWLPDGGRMEYGNAPGGNALVRGMQFDSDSDGTAIPLAEVTKRWLIHRRVDLAGNFLTYSYAHDQTTTPTERIGYQVLLSEIRYSGHASLTDGERYVHFEYAATAVERQDAFDNGFWEYSSQILKRVWMQAPGDTLVTRSYELQHSVSPHTGRPLLDRVDLCDGAGVCLAPTQLSYSEDAAPEVEFDVVSLGPIPTGWHNSENEAVPEEYSDFCVGRQANALFAADLNGSGEDDLLYFERTVPCEHGVEYEYRARFNDNGTLGPAVPVGIPPATGRLAPELPRLAMLDLDADGRVDVFDRRTVAALGDVRFIRREWDAATGTLASVDSDLMRCGNQSFAELGDHFLIGDVDGNGSPDVLGGCEPPECAGWGEPCGAGGLGCCTGWVCDGGAGTCAETPGCGGPSASCTETADCCSGLVCEGGSCGTPIGAVDWFVRAHDDTDDPMQPPPQHDSLRVPELFYQGDLNSSSAILLDHDGDAVLAMLAYGVFGTDEPPPTHYGAGAIDVAGAVTFTPTNFPVQDPRMQVYLDVNGDGLRDLLDLGAGAPATIQLNSGRGLIEPMSAYLLPAALPAGTYDGRNPSDVRVADFNQDGREDFLLLHEGDPDTPGDSFYVLHYATDAGFKRYYAFFAAEPLYRPAAGGLPMFRSWGNVQLGDFDGDAEIDMVASSHSELLLYTNRHFRPDLLETVTLAAPPYDDVPQVRIHYAKINSGQSIRSYPDGTPSRVLYGSAASCEWPQRCVRKGITVVERHSELATTDQLLTDPYHIAHREEIVSAHFEHTYSEAAYDTRGQGFLGFRQRERVRWEAIPFEPASSGAPYTRRDWIRTRWEYDLTSKADDGALAYVGMPVAVEEHASHLMGGRYHAVRTEVGRVAAQPVNLQPSAGGEPVLFIRPTSQRVYEYDLASAPAMLAGNPAYSRRITTSFSYDDYSVAVRRTHQVEGGDFEETVLVPDQDPLSNLLLRYSQITTTSNVGGEVASRDVTMEHDPSSGLLDRTTVNPTDPQRARVMDLTYRATGVVDRVDEIAWDPDTPVGTAPIIRRTAHLTYDAEDLYPASVGVEIGPTTTLTTSVLFHPALGVLQRVVGPNGATREAYHDGFGRLRREEDPGGAVTTHDYVAASSAYDQHVVRSVGNDGSESERTIDAFGRMRRLRSLSDQPGVWWAQSWHFDPRGLLTHAAVPHVEGATPAYRVFEHDDLGRRVRAVDPDGEQWLTIYDLDSVSGTHAPRRMETTTPTGHMWAQTLDVNLRLSQTIEPGGAATTYSYGPFGLLRRADLPMGAYREVTYDSNGLLASVVDSAAGTRTFDRDAFGQPFRVTHADGSTVDARFDGAGRLLSRTSARGTSTFLYDMSANGMGLLGEGLAEDGTRQDLVYDSDGRLDRVTQTNAAGDAVSVDYDYDAVGQLKVVRTTGPGGGLAGGAGLEYAYRQGYLTEVTSLELGQTVWEAVLHHPQGFVAEERYPLTGLDVDRDLDATDRQVGFQSSVQGLVVDLNEDGNVSAVTDAFDGTGGGQTLTYDDRGRLASWAWSGTTLGATYSYDDLSDVLVNESSVLTYDPVTHRLATVDGAAVSSDVRGRVDATGGRNITWRDFDLFDQVQDTATGENVAFQYTASQSRAGWQASGGDSSIQVGDLYRRDSSGGDVRETFAVPGATRIVAELVSENGDTPRMRFLHDDHLGSTAVATEDGVAEQRFWHSPFGRRVDPQSSALMSASADFADRPRFTSHQTDGQAPLLGAQGAGFVHMRGREYDPRVGRFLTQDPMTPVGPTVGGWNPYAYVLNNPGSVVDPTGFWPLVDDPLIDLSGLVSPSDGESFQGLPSGLLSALARAWMTASMVLAHQQGERPSDLFQIAGFLNGLGVPGTAPPDYGFLREADEVGYYRGQLLGSAVGIGADLFLVASAMTGQGLAGIAETLAGILAAIGGPHGRAAAAMILGGSAATTAVSVVAASAGVGLGTGLHGPRFAEAIDNLNRLHSEALTGRVDVASTGVREGTGVTRGRSAPTRTGRAPRASGGRPRLSPNQMNRAIRRGHAPRGIARVDRGRFPGEQTHVHLDGGAALNIDGTWRHGSARLTRAQREWLGSNGWRLPE